MKQTVRPDFVGPQNAAAFVGLTWRDVQAVAAAVDVPVLSIAGARLVPAERFRRALESVADRDVNGGALGKRP